MNKQEAEQKRFEIGLALQGIAMQIPEEALPQLKSRFETIEKNTMDLVRHFEEA